MDREPKPIKRSNLRRKLGNAYYGMLRCLKWIKMNSKFAKVKNFEPFPYKYFSHQTLLRRKLRNVDMWMQENKIVNLKIAVKKLNGIVIHPGEVFSYWKLIGKPTKRKGYLDGMFLRNGGFVAGTGGGLCQLSNLIFWMTIHTPLTVIERHRHGYDVFPDSNRTQPFASGATCSYPHIDLMIRNDTNDDYQLFLNVGEEYLEGEWRSSKEPVYRYEIIERDHEMRAEFWGGYTRRNKLYQQIFDLEGNMLEEKLLLSNTAIMIIRPICLKTQMGKINNMIDKGVSYAYT